MECRLPPFEMCWSPPCPRPLLQTWHFYNSRDDSENRLKELKEELWRGRLCVLHSSTHRSRLSLNLLPVNVCFFFFFFFFRVLFSDRRLRRGHHSGPLCRLMTLAHSGAGRGLDPGAEGARKSLPPGACAPLARAALGRLLKLYIS